MFVCVCVSVQTSMFQHGIRSSIYCTYMLYMINATCVELDKSTAFNTCGVICLPRSLSVHTGDRTRSHKTIAKNIRCVG